MSREGESKDEADDDITVRLVDETVGWQLEKAERKKKPWKKKGQLSSKVGEGT